MTAYVTVGLEWGLAQWGKKRESGLERCWPEEWVQPQQGFGSGRVTPRGGGVSGMKGAAPSTMTMTHNSHD